MWILAPSPTFQWIAKKCPVHCVFILFKWALLSHHYGKVAMLILSLLSSLVTTVTKKSLMSHCFGTSFQMSGLIHLLMPFVGLLVKTNGLCAVIDSHQHVATNSSGMIIMADHPKKAILEYSHSLRNQS